MPNCATLPDKIVGIPIFIFSSACNIEGKPKAAKAVPNIPVFKKDLLEVF